MNELGVEKNLNFLWQIGLKYIRIWCNELHTLYCDCQLQSMKLTIFFASILILMHYFIYFPPPPVTVICNLWGWSPSPCEQIWLIGLTPSLCPPSVYMNSPLGDMVAEILLKFHHLSNIGPILDSSWPMPSGNSLYIAIYIGQCP